MRQIFALIAILLAALAITLIRISTVLALTVGTALVYVTLMLWYSSRMVRGLSNV